jgi:hypothetical protein
MVIVRLMGGLGNQMFQYAAGRRLAYSLDVELKLDLTWFKQPDRRPYGLGAFNIMERMASPEDIRHLTLGRAAFLQMAMRKFLGFKFQPPKSYIKEESFSFDSSILSLNDSVYLDGYWQNEKYFIDIKPTIRADFTLEAPPSERIESLTKTIASCDSVSIHIRRGDYLLEDKIKFHGLCSLDYYQRCVDIMIQSVSNPHFFVFSDDYQWAISNLKLPYKTTYLYPSNENLAFEDLWLISKCKNHIIANSSFSWWGAWLSQNPSKIVIVPKKWFQIEENDWVPPDWLRV